MKTNHPALILSTCSILAALGLAGCAAPPPTTAPSPTTVPAVAPPGLRKATLRVEGMT